ncbi:MAG: hypothetical protein WCT16_01130 [Candidatus Buchananbacteria bacterium]
MKTASKTGNRNKKVGTGIITAITVAVVSQGGKAEDLTAVVGHNELLKQLAAAVIELSRKIIQLVIDYRMTLAQMIIAGKYDRVNSDINAEHFPINGKGKKAVDIELWHPNRYFKNGDEVIAELKKSKYGYRFATLPELLALGAAQPELQRQFLIAALGSIWRRTGYRRFAYLHGSDAMRDLDLGFLGGAFHGYWRFAVVRDPACR